MRLAPGSGGSLILEHPTSCDDYCDRFALFRGQEIADRDLRQWWVFYTKSRQEKALANHLLIRGIPHYLPLYKKHMLSRGRRVTSLVPVFSGYMFLFGDRDERIVALESNRVARTIDVPQFYQEQLLHELLQIQRLIDSNLPLSIESRIQPGRRVRIKSGRLAGLEGIVTHRRGKSRLLVAVDYLQQGASIEVDDFLVEAI